MMVEFLILKQVKNLYQVNPEQYEHQKELCKKWRQTHREEYNAKRRLRRHSIKTL